MKKQDKRMEMVREFHLKYKVPILDVPSLITKDRSDFRYKLINDEVQEYKLGVESADLENIAKELVDILYGVYGTIYEHGLQDKLDEIFEEVHRSHMSKDYHQYKLVKGPSYFKPDLKKILDK
jgi:predicted HAD superfamily Cof-like phosphohydrolase